MMQRGRIVLIELSEARLVLLDCSLEKAALYSIAAASHDLRLSIIYAWVRGSCMCVLLQAARLRDHEVNIATLAHLEYQYAE